MKKFFALWCFSVLFFSIYFVSIFFFMHTFQFINMLFYFAFLAVGLVLYSVSSKKLVYKEGYSLFQVASFYLTCKKNGIETINDYKSKPKILKKICKKINWTSTLDDNQMQEAFLRGRSFIIEKRIIE